VEGIDYFVKHGDWNVDLKDVLTGSGYGKSTPSLNEICAACGIPGKGAVDGSSVLELWQRGEIAEIVRYNQADALRTYLLHLRVLHLAGFIDLAVEESRLAAMLETLARMEGNEHLRAFLEEWAGVPARGGAA
jgi:predicted PolB exonuclease-like 3'-5' exonuclease